MQKGEKERDKGKAGSNWFFCLANFFQPDTRIRYRRRIATVILKQNTETAMEKYKGATVVKFNAFTCYSEARNQALIHVNLLYE